MNIILKIVKKVFKIIIVFFIILVFIGIYNSYFTKNFNLYRNTFTFGNSNGQCAGIVCTEMFLFNDREKFMEYVDHLNKSHELDNMRKGKLSAYKKSDSDISRIIENSQKENRDTKKLLRSVKSIKGLGNPEVIEQVNRIINNKDDPKTLFVGLVPESWFPVGGHAVLAYGMTKNNDKSYILKVADPNNPNHSSKLEIGIEEGKIKFYYPIIDSKTGEKLCYSNEYGIIIFAKSSFDENGTPKLELLESK